MNRKQLIKKYIDFFKSKDHKEIPNASLIPENDPTVLFTTAGMHPLVPFLLGEKHPQGKRLVNVQRCIRTGDIDQVGDTTHHTFFEMLGNWSLGDYFKKESIEYSFEFLTKTLKLSKEKLAVTVFKGDKNAPKDEESAEIWKSLGVKKISFLGKKDNWWGPTGTTGPCGPDTEIFVNDIEIWNNVLMQYNKDEKGNYNEAQQKNIDTGMGVERTIAVLQGYDDNYLTDCWKPIIDKIVDISGHDYINGIWKNEEGISEKANEVSGEVLKEMMRIIADHIKAAVFIIADGIVPSNTEQGYVLRRLIRRAMRNGRKLGIQGFIEKVATTAIGIYGDYEILQKNHEHIIKTLIEEESKFEKTLEKGIEENEVPERALKNFTNIAASMNAVSEKLTSQMKAMNSITKNTINIGNITKRLTAQAGAIDNIAKSAQRAQKIIEKATEPTRLFTESINRVIENSSKFHDVINKAMNNMSYVNRVIENSSKFHDVINKTIKKMEHYDNMVKRISAKQSFLLYQSYGFPIEMTKELAEEKGIGVDEEGFHKELAKHQKLSRTASAGKFKSGLADNSEQTTKLHTACHLLNEALREVLKDKNIFQRGANITPERLRFDFNLDRRLTDEEKKAIEDLVNKKIKENIPVELEEMTPEKAKKAGAAGIFDSKYGDKVKVYSIGDFSKEICAGPHVENTSELGTFKITKEQSSGAGVRRIKAILE